MSINSTWLLLPLLTAVSLVYNATRYEDPERILRRSLKWCGLLMVFFGSAFLLLFLCS